MSSFAIEKREYIKAAGLVAGIVKAREVWIFNHRTQRNSEPEDFYDEFVRCFEMNAVSVQEQYHEDVPWSDSNEYRIRNLGLCFNRVIQDS